MSTLAALALTVGFGLAPEGGLMKLELAHEDTPVYLWASVEGSESRVLGQHLADLDFASVGLGVSQELVGGLSVFGELGYTYVDDTVDQRTSQEVVFAHLVGRHNVPTRPIPVPLGGPYDTTTYSTDYSIDHSYVARLGLKWRISDHLRASVSYRHFRPEESMNLWDPVSRANGGGWWTETNPKDLGGTEVLISWQF